MDYELRKRLPLELVEIIMKETHKKNFRPCLSQIKYCVVKIYAPKDGGYGFITSNNHNYYEALMENDELTFEVINNQLKKKYAEGRKIHVREIHPTRQEIDDESGW